MAAAEAEAERLTAHAEATAATRANMDAEEETLRRFTELSAAIAGQVNGAGANVGPLRTALTNVFAEFRLMRANSISDDGLTASTELVVWPVLRDGILNERVAVPFAVEPAPSNYQHGTLLWKYMTQYTLRLS